VHGVQDVEALFASPSGTSPLVPFRCKSISYTMMLCYLTESLKIHAALTGYYNEISPPSRW
jgi:hypothetical protein